MKSIHHIDVCVCVCGNGKQKKNCFLRRSCGIINSGSTKKTNLMNKTEQCFTTWLVDEKNNKKKSLQL